MTEAALPVIGSTPRTDRLSSVRYFLRKNPRMLVGLVLLTILLFVAVFAPIIAPYDPIKVNITDTLEPPSLNHLLGTDDRLAMCSRGCYGARGSRYRSASSPSASASSWA